MGRPRKQAREPFWFADRNAWYAMVGSNEDPARRRQGRGWRVWRELMVRRPEEPAPILAAAHTVGEVIDRCLEWAEKNRVWLT